MPADNPLLVTLAIDAKAQLFFNCLRQKHFPAERNYLDAHLMLFHHLPAGEPSIAADLKSVAEQTHEFSLNISSVVCIGRGVAYKITSPQLSSIHQQLQQKWQQWLIPQDRQTLWPHITIQNKVDSSAAKSLAKELSENLEPFEITGSGLQLWEYRGGPWSFIRQFGFEK